ncbi:MAG TPA: cache domain-containing protein [Nitrososphaeraceae archaeon]|nr:cache domain-containing protein [Nitrososphaeraceae archaeon]
MIIISPKTSDNVHSAIIVGALATFLLLAMLIVSSLTTSASTTQDLNQTETAEKETIGGYQKNPIANLLANDLETRINKSGAILEITSRLPEVKSTPFANSINPELHGIPRDMDLPKRKVAQDILETDKDFEVIYFLMPNGDMYLEEPYSRQENLTRGNFAFRDYFRGALDSHDTYLGDIIISASSGRPQANIAVPIYSGDNKTLVGVWAAGLNITVLDNSLQSLNLTSHDQRVVYLDQQGQKIADSNSQSRSSSPIGLNNTGSNESFANLQAFKNAINGQSGSTTEIIDGKMMLVSYYPVKAISNVWAVLFMEPYRLAETGRSSSNVSMLSSPPIVSP